MLSPLFASIGVVVLGILYLFLFRKIRMTRFRRAAVAISGKTMSKMRRDSVATKERQEFLAKKKKEEREEARKEAARIPSPGSEMTPDP